MLGKICIRLGLSAIITIIYSLSFGSASVGSKIGAATIAGNQLQNSSIAAITAPTGISAFHVIPTTFTIFWLAALAYIWGTFFKPFFKKATPALLAIGALLTLARPAHAYYATQDRAEAVGIPPNSTAFWIPDQGNTQATQQQTDDASFYNSHTVPGKIFIVPHSIFSNSGGSHIWDQDYYVPDGRLILVDRTPVTREWTSAPGTGTSSTDQSFQCQSNDGLNVGAAVSIAVSIQPGDAATYLYYFGTDPIAPNPNDAYMQANPNADPSNDPNVIFASVYHAKSLTNVMDTVGHGLIEASVCQAIGANDLQTDNKDYNSIMDTVQKTAQAYLDQRGITIDYIGWAGTFSFDSDVQKAINNLFIAQTDGPILTTLQDAAGITAIQSWDGHLPNSLTLLGQDQTMGGLLTGLISAKASATK